MKNDRRVEHELLAELNSAYQKVHEVESQLKEHGHREGDETEHLQTMSEVRDSEVRYRRLFEAAKDGILILDADSGAITDANPFIREILGYSPEDLIGKRLWEIGAFFDVVASKAAFEELQRKEYIRYENLPLQTKDGQLREVEFISNVYMIDLKKVIQCNIRNITKRREAIKAIEESEVRYRRLFESAKDGILILDAETGKIIDANPFLLKIINYPQDEVIGKELWEIGSFKEIIANQDTFRKLQHQEYVRYEHLLLQNKSGVTIHVEFISNFYFMNERKVIQCNIRDITERNRAEVDIRRMATVVRDSNDAITIQDFEGRITAWNRGAVLMYGYSEEEALLANIERLTIPEKVEEQKDFTRRLLAGEKLSSFETKRMTKDGRVLDVWMTVTKLMDDAGKPIGIASTERDITERKWAEKKVTQLAAIVQSSEDAIIGKSLDGIIMSWNKGAEKIYGYTESEVIGKSISLLISPGNEDKMSGILNRIRSGEFIEHYEIARRRKDGREIQMSLTISPIRDPEGKIIAASTIGRDITKRKQTEVAMRESEERYRGIFENVQDVYYEALIDGTILEVSPSIELMTKGQYNRDDLIGKSMYDFYSIAGGRQTLLSLLQERGSVSDYEITLKNRDGSQVPCSISAKIQLDVQGTPLKIIGSMRDITERKRIEEELKFKNIILSTQQEVSIDGILVIDENGKILTYNPPFVKMWGISPEVIETQSDELVLKSVMEKLEEPQQFIEKVEYLYAHKNETSREEIALKDGRILDRYSAPMLGAVAKYYGRVWYFRDITERKRTEEDLRETRDYLENLLSFANAPIMVWDNNNRITRFNLAFERMTGYSMYDVLGKHPEILFPNETREDFSTLISRTSDGENLMSIEMPIHCKDGNNRTVLWNTANIYSVDGKTIISTIALGQDITKRKRVEEELQESEVRFRSLYENVTIGLYRTTPDGKILLANSALVEMLGYSSFEKLAERNLEKNGFEPSYQRKEFLEKIERDGVVNGYDSKWTRQDGTVIFVLESARAIRDSQGKTLYYDGTVENITNRKLLEEQMRQMQKLEGLGTLAGGIAHDFNNILGIILGYSTSIKRFKDDPKKLDLAAETITKAVDRGKTLVQSILIFARKTETTFGAVNINDVVMEILTMILETFPKTLTYSQNFDKAVPYINADRSQLHQALLNLCVNARDVMPKGGVLTINTRMVSSISLRYQHPDALTSSYVCIEVSDTGEGMSEEIRKRIFEPFFTTKGIGKGTGLGLSIVFGVIQSHKGFIDVDSELGKGTTFRLYLPASQVAEPIIEKEEETLESILGGTETLLIVEDEEMLLTSLQMILVDKGYKVLSAQDGFTALKIYQEKKNEIALVLTDLGLPNISGLEVCQQIKAINPNQHVILASGYIDPNMKSELLKMSIQYFLYKPYDLTKVLKMVREVLDEK
jgi:two-component system cell cycle sensor histidine kinase/response regulator CckA